MPVIDTDVCIIGGGITAAMLAETLSEVRPGLSITIVEAGNALFDRAARDEARRRAIEYGENPWPGDFIADQTGAEGLIALTMAVGGLALRWGGACNRFSVEDLRLESLYGLAVDWPIAWDDLERWYVEAERRLNVFGDPGAYPADRRSAPYPVPAQPLSYNLRLLREWAEQSGTQFDPLPMAHNLTPFGGRGACCLLDTCGQVCPTGARYSPDYTITQLVEARRVTLHTRTLVRRLLLDDTRDTIAAAQAVHRDRPDDPVEYRARTFVLAAGHAWSPYLLLLSANTRFPDGLANRSGTVGRYMNGHKFLSAQVSIDTQLYPGQLSTYSLISRRYFRCPPDRPFVRHDTRVWESAAGRGPRLRGNGGRLLMGDELLNDWRGRTRGGSVRLRAYYDIHPDRSSGITLNPAARNTWGDPLPKLVHTFDAASIAREAATQAHIHGVFNELARADNGRVNSTSEGEYLDHPAGGCRMGTDPASSVCDSYGRTHDHENLFVVGAPTLPTGGCTNGTLTFVALTLRSAERIAEGFPRTRAQARMQAEV
ncbi:MAG TPA: GMC family oxidoreductase [Vicinamibacterales bacterium]|nr:GMC family oxidoreductase [Vicinamibacterales bacterium]